MSITKRLLLSLSLSMLALLLVGGYGIWQLTQAQGRFGYEAKYTFPSIRSITDTQHRVSDMRLDSLKALTAPTDNMRKIARQDIAAADIKINANVADYSSNDMLTDTGRQKLATVVSAMDHYRKVRDTALAKAQAGENEGGLMLLMVNGLAAATELTKTLDDLTAYNFVLADNVGKANHDSYILSLELSIALMIASFTLIGIIGVQLFRIIKGGLTGIQQSLWQVSETLDFTQRAEVVRMDEIGLTATAFNGLLEKLQHSLRSLQDGAQQVASASQQLSQTAGQVSAASEAQSEASANMAATVEQMTVSVNHVAEQAKQTHTGAVEAGNLVTEGSQIISQTISDIHHISGVVKTSAASINELEAYSNQVSTVVNVIRDIADQTNLLALNAAIEAARAGEQGRGFAVVADEVRKLAERTAKSTQEISSTIESMVTHAQQATQQMLSADELVESGVLRADNADQAIKRIGKNTANATHSINEIATAINQQGVASNNIAVQVEKTAQMAEESSAAAKNTLKSAEHLDKLAQSQMATLAQYTLG